MDEIRFDTLTRALAAAGSRRSLLGVLGVSFVGLLTLRAGPTAAKKGKRKGKKGKKKKENPSPVTTVLPPPPPPPPECVTKDDCPLDARINPQLCLNGRCCISGSYDCDLFIYPDHEACCAEKCCSGYCVDHTGFSSHRYVCPAV